MFDTLNTTKIGPRYLIKYRGFLSKMAMKMFYCINVHKTCRV